MNYHFTLIGKVIDYIATVKGSVTLPVQFWVKESLLLPPSPHPRSDPITSRAGHALELPTWWPFLYVSPTPLIISLYIISFEQPQLSQYVEDRAKILQRQRVERLKVIQRKSGNLRSKRLIQVGVRREGNQYFVYYLSCCYKTRFVYQNSFLRQIVTYNQMYRLS